MKYKKMNIKDDTRFFVLGATGFLGKNLLRRLEAEAFDCIGTSRKYVDKDNFIQYDIEENTIDSIVERKSKTKKNIVLFCIAASNIKWCEENESEAYRINVEKTAETIEKLIDNGFKVIWFSSDNVFDGEKGGYTEEDKTNPINVYGKTKAKMENYILSNEVPVCILRLSKVIDTEKDPQNLLTELQNQIDNNEQIRCIKDNVLSFTILDDIYRACFTIIENDFSGLYNLGLTEGISRYDFAQLFISTYCGSYDNIAELEEEKFRFVGGRPHRICMNSEKMKKCMDKWSDLPEVIYKYIG